MPKISVLTTVYNGSKYLHETVESVLSQTFEDFEYIIVDDGSTDGTLGYLKSLNDPRIRVISLPRSGRGTALNKGLMACTSDFIAIIDADDVNSPIRLEVQMRYMDRHPEMTVLSCVCRPDKEGLDLQISKLCACSDVLHIGHSSFMKRTPISHSGVLMRRDPVLNVGGYDEARKNLYDYDLWLRLAKDGCSFAKVPANLVFKRIHNKQNFESRDRIRYLAAGFNCRIRAVRLFSKNPFNYFYPIAGFIYGLLPIRIRKRDN